MTFYSGACRRSFACNGRLMRSIRERRGLRQLDLARLAGYSVRLIGKAEAGKPLSTETIEVLAEALSSEELTVSPTDLMLNPLAIAEEYMESMHTYKSDVVLKIEHVIALDFVLNVVVDNSIVPFQKSYAGADGLKSYYNQFFIHFQMAAGLQNNDSPYKIFESKNEVVIWNEVFWKLATDSTHDLAASLTTNLIFDNGSLIRQEDRFAMASGAPHSTS